MLPTLTELLISEKLKTDAIMKKIKKDKK